MKFGYTIIYVPDVLASVEFFESAFGLERRFVHESGYAEMDTYRRQSLRRSWMGSSRRI